MDMKGVVQFGDSYIEAFNICSGVKQDFVLAPTLFCIFVIICVRGFY